MSVKLLKLLSFRFFLNISMRIIIFEKLFRGPSYEIVSDFWPETRSQDQRRTSKVEAAKYNWSQESMARVTLPRCPELECIGIDSNDLPWPSKTVLLHPSWMRRKGFMYGSVVDWSVRFSRMIRLIRILWVNKWNSFTCPRRWMSDDAVCHDDQHRTKDISGIFKGDLQPAVMEFLRCSCHQKDASVW